MMQNLIKIINDKEKIKINLFGLRISHSKREKKKRNIFVLVKKDGRKILNPRIKGLEVQFNGGENFVKLYEPLPAFHNTKIVCGKKCRVVIGTSKYYIYDFTLDLPTERSVAKIGNDFSIVSGNFFLDYRAKVIVGSNCMFSADVWLRGGDAHVITDENGNLLVAPSHIVIGDNVWIGLKALLLKKTGLPDGSIVGTGAVVTKQFTAKNCVIAGNPARIVRENTYWNRRNLSSYFLTKKDEG